jgi:hypothetical protein
MQRACLYCKVINAKVVCEKCGSYYCCELCRSNDWTRHKNLCYDTVTPSQEELQKVAEMAVDILNVNLDKITIYKDPDSFCIAEFIMNRQTNNIYLLDIKQRNINEYCASSKLSRTVYTSNKLLWITVYSERILEVDTSGQSHVMLQAGIPISVLEL